MRVVVGLGNPGRRYADTRHNVGFAVVRELGRRWHMPALREGRQVHVAQGTIAGASVVLVEPQMYMNLSGEALAYVPDAQRAGDLIVVHDDLDLEPGVVRVKCGGGTAGHHGLDSIVARYGPGFDRVRVGIGHPAPGTETADHVLSPFVTEERSLVDTAVARAADAVECIVQEGMVTAMNRFNTRLKRGATVTAAPLGRN